MPRLDRLAGDHLVHGDVLADVAQEVEHGIGRSSPVVDQRGPRLAAKYAGPDLGLDGADVGVEGRGVEQVALLERPLGSPTMPVAPPARAIGRCPASWKRRRTSRPMRLPMCRLSAGGVAPVVERGSARGQALGERRPIGRVTHEALASRSSRIVSTLMVPRRRAAAPPHIAATRPTPPRLAHVPPGPPD